MKYEKTIYVSKEQIEFVNKVMAIENEEDPAWEDYENLKDCTVERFSATFENGYFADINICSGTSNFFIDPILFTPKGHEACVCECAWELLGDYEFESEGTEYILHIEERPYKVFRKCFDTNICEKSYFDNPTNTFTTFNEALDYLNKLTLEELECLNENSDTEFKVEKVGDFFDIKSNKGQLITQLWVSNDYETVA